MDLIQRILSNSELELARLIGKKLEEKRHCVRLRQSELAKLIGISIPTYKKMVDGEGKLINYISAMKAIDFLDLLEPLFYESDNNSVTASPTGRRVRPGNNVRPNQSMERASSNPENEIFEYDEDEDEDDW